MNKLFTKIATVVVGFAMAIGVGVAVGANQEAIPVHASPETGFTAATMTAGTNGSSCTVNTYSGIKVGTSSKGGDMSIEVPSGATKLVLYAAAWKGVTGLSLSITKTDGATSATILPSSIALTADDGISNNSPFTLSGTESNFRFELTLANITANTTYKFTGSAAKRFVVWSAQTQAAATYTISYNANGGSGTMSSTTGTDPAVAACTFTPPSNKQFSYWHTTSSGTGGTTYAAGDTPKKNLNLYAIWEDLPSDDPFVSLTLTSEANPYKGTTVTVSADSGNLAGSGLTWTVTEGTVDNVTSSNTSFSGTLASTGTVTIKAQDNGGNTYDTVSLTVKAVTVGLDESSITVRQRGKSALTASVNTGSVIWSSNNAKVTVTADTQNQLIGNISVASDATINSTATITATSTIDGTVSASCVLTVSENPFIAFTKLTDVNQVSTNSVYALTNEETYWLGSSIASSQVAAVTSINSIGYVKLETTTGGYFLKFVVKNSQGSFDDATDNKYIDNSSGTSLTADAEGSSVWSASADGTSGIILQNTSNGNRFLGWSKGEVTASSVTKAYATSNLHAGDNNTPLYLYQVPQNVLDGLSISNQTTSFTAGSTFTLGNSAVLTAHYSLSGNTTDLSGGTLSYKINNVAVTTNTVLDHDTHNGKTVVVTYTDAHGDSASITGYTITVNYKPAESISLNLDSKTLYLNGKVDLTATVSDQYANPNDVSWSTSAPGVASISATSGTKTITVTSVAGGTATITATANGYSAVCNITVISDPVLYLFDDSQQNIDGETIAHFTGDTSVMIMAESKNVVSPVFNWSNEDDSVVTIDVADEYCEVTIVGAGSSDVSITVGSLTRTVTFSVTQSGVTSLTLTSSVPSGELYDGTYNNTLTLTPAVTLVGNATGVINWSSSDTDVATVSATSTTAPTAITVTGVGAGTATITAASVYTPAMTETFDVTVSADGVTSLSWTNRPKFNSSAAGFQRIWAGDTTLGDLISQNGSYGIGTFAPTWKSEKSDTPTMGTGEHDVHIGIYDTATPKAEGTPLTSSYVFTNDDNGKYVVAFYEGKASGYNTSLSITKWRSVIETEDVSSTITWSSASATVTGDASATVTNVQYYYYEDNSMRLGTGNGGGKLKIETEADITSVVITAKAYNADRAGTLTVGDKSLSVTNTDYQTFDELTLGTPTTELVLSTPGSSVRITIQSIVIHCSGSQQIGKTDDCMGLESFINTNLHMSDYTTELGYCSDDEHHYYATAKAAFNLLNEHQRSLFVSNSAYALEYARLSAWAKANGDAFNNEDTLAPGSRITLFINIDNSNMASIIVIISMISIAAIGGYYFLRKRKED